MSPFHHESLVLPSSGCQLPVGSPRETKISVRSNVNHIIPNFQIQEENIPFHNHWSKALKIYADWIFPESAHVDREMPNTYWFRSGLPGPMSRSRDGVTLSGRDHPPGNGVDSNSPAPVGGVEPM